MTDPLPVRGPLCDQQESIDGDPTGPVLRCHLPAGHRSEEHYDRTFGLVWRRTAPQDPTICACGHPDNRHYWFGEHPCAIGSRCGCTAFTPAQPLDVPQRLDVTVNHPGVPQPRTGD